MVRRITIPENKEEIHAMIYMLLVHKFAFSRTDIMAGKVIGQGQYDGGEIDEIINRINSLEPIQYIINTADFWGRKFFVDPSVLIPRPETEELVKQVILVASNFEAETPRIADIGTGSGCIAITLSLEMPRAQIFATDISARALLIANRNAVDLGAQVEFFEHDLLLEMLPVSSLDIVVSNPPYIPLEEKVRMSQTVHAFEPHDALFVLDDDHLLFYRALAVRAWDVLKDEGFLAVEINERFGADISSLFFNKGYSDVQVLTDLSKKERMVLARKPFNN
ncbi:MAG: peptide chain release factor N(5)-glutamine methyltransferase [Chryseolinea sp.]